MLGDLRLLDLTPEQVCAWQVTSRPLRGDAGAASRVNPAEAEPANISAAPATRPQAAIRASRVQRPRSPSETWQKRGPTRPRASLEDSSRR
jgi:hypothetical protein